LNSDADTVPWRILSKALAKDFRFTASDLAHIKEDCNSNGDDCVSQSKFHIFTISTGVIGALNNLKSLRQTPSVISGGGFQRESRTLVKDA